MLTYPSFCIGKLLQHVLSHSRRREVDDEDEDVDGRGLCVLVLGCQRDLQGWQDSKSIECLEERFPGLRLKGLRKGAKFFQKQNGFLPFQFWCLFVSKL